MNVIDVGDSAINGDSAPSVKLTGTTTGLAAPGAYTVMLALYVPALRPVASAVTVSDVPVQPLAGVTVNHVALSLMDQLTAAPVLLRSIVCGLGETPTVELKFSEAGVAATEGAL